MAKFNTFAEIKEADKIQIKKENPIIKLISIPLENEDLEEADFLLRPPSRNVLNAIGKSAVEKDIEEVNKILIKNCVIGGDMKFIDADYKDQSIYTTLLGEISKLQKVKEVTVKKF